MSSQAFFADHLENFVSIQIGQHDVQQDDVRPFLRNADQGIFTALRQPDLETASFHEKLQGDQNARFIVDYENTFRFHGSHRMLLRLWITFGR